MNARFLLGLALIFSWSLFGVRADDALVKGSSTQLVEEFNNSKVFWQQFKIARRIVALDDTNILPALAGALTNDDRHARGNAALIFAAMGNSRGFEVLREILADKSERPEGQGIPGPGWSLQRQIATDRYYAVHLFGDLKDPRAVPLLIPLLHDHEVDWIVPWALGEIGDQRAVEPLIQELSDQDPSMRVLAIQSLEKLKAREAVPRLHELLNDQSKSRFDKEISVAEAARTALILDGDLFASEPDPNSPSQTDLHNWEYIQYPGDLPNSPTFLIGWPCGGNQRADEMSRGLRMDILSVRQGFAFFKTNSITARLYRANGEIVEPTTEGKKLLNAPVSADTIAWPGAEPAPQVMTYFPWGPNVLEEDWIEVTMGPERYWVEIPYGFDRNPADPLAPANTNGPPHFVPAMKLLTEHDLVVRWENVHYNLGQTPNGGTLSLIQSNPARAVSDVGLYNFPKRQNIYSPHLDVNLLDADGTVSKSRCVNLHLDDDCLRRTDTFQVFDQGADDLRCWGQIEVSFDARTYCVVVPSSLYRYVHGHARKPIPTDFLSQLRVGMTLEEADRTSRNYIYNGITNHPASGYQYRYVFTPDTNAVTLQFDESDRLVSWK